MFEKEAKRSFDELDDRGIGDDWSIEESYVCGFSSGAEFGYNKANGWHSETPSSAVGNKDLLLQVAKDDFVVGYYHFEKKRFYTNDGQEVIPLAWKEIHYPQESEK